jgi:ABC-type antimicrobial peptide transport system permease subunit
VEPIDPLTLVLSAVLVVAVTLLASYAPAYRASRVNPLTALRHE